MITETWDAAQELDVRQRAAEGARLLLAAQKIRKTTWLEWTGQLSTCREWGHAADCGDYGARAWGDGIWGVGVHVSFGFR
jgi:hypothetical protein